MPKNKSKLLPVIIVIGAVVTLVWFILRPVRGTITVRQNQNPKAQSETADTPKSYSGNTIAFTYPGSYFPQTNPDESSGYSDRIVLLGQGLQTKKLAIAVKPAPNQELANIPAVLSRRLKPGIYTETDFSLAGVPGLLFFANSDGFEMTGLVIRNRNLVTISLSSTSTGPILEKEYQDDFNSVVSSWVWN